MSSASKKMILGLRSGDAAALLTAGVDCALTFNVHSNTKLKINNWLTTLSGNFIEVALFILMHPYWV
jgi:hypothetical protein